MSSVILGAFKYRTIFLCGVSTSVYFMVKLQAIFINDYKLHIIMNVPIEFTKAENTVLDNLKISMNANF